MNENEHRAPIEARLYSRLLTELDNLAEYLDKYRTEADPRTRRKLSGEIRNCNRYAGLILRTLSAHGRPICGQ